MLYFKENLTRSISPTTLIKMTLAQIVSNSANFIKEQRFSSFKKKSPVWIFKIPNNYVFVF